MVDHADNVRGTAGTLLSIVVPCIDEHEVLNRFLRSVADRLAGTEVVVVNMGGWRASPDLCEALVLRPVTSEIMSIAAAKNFGLRHATRPYVALMDSDNVLLGPPEEWNGALADALASGPDMVSLGRREASRRLPVGVKPSKWNFSRHTIGWSVIWKREHLERIGGFDERFGRGAVAACGEDFGALYTHFADPAATTYPLAQLGVGHPSLQRPVSAIRLYRYTYGSATSALLPLRNAPSALAAYWSAKTIAGFAADLVRGVHRGDIAWTRVVLRARARAVRDAALLGEPRRLSSTARRVEERP